MRPGYIVSSQPAHLPSQLSTSVPPSSAPFPGVEIICLASLISLAIAAVFCKHHQRKALRDQLQMLERVWQLDTPNKIR